MNKNRRSQIICIKECLINTKSKLNNILRDEEWAFDSMPEGLQSSDSGQKSEEAISLLDETVEIIDDAIDTLSEIV